jgi:hypothetical protein
MLRFKGNDLRPVLAEAKANRSRVILVKDQGVYFMSDKGENNAEGRRKLLAYAVGCNPEVDDFDQWWDLARNELGGDDFGEFLNVNEPVFTRILESDDDLLIHATPSELHLETAKPISESGKEPCSATGIADPKITQLESFCMDCDVDTLANKQYYMLKERLWKRINPQLTGMLCLKCAEQRLGRALTRRDFKRIPLNTIQARLCPELAERMNRDP